MFWRVTKKEAAARRSSQMEGRDHSNAANPKSLMSRGNLIKILLIAFVSQFAVFSYGQTWQIGYPNAADITATHNNGTFIISGKGEMMNWDDDRSRPWHSIRDEILTVVINSGITKIGICAFRECVNLSSVSIANTVTNVGDLAFNLCYSLISITIPDKVQTIGKWAFATGSLTSIDIPKSVIFIDDVAFSQNSGLTDVTVHWDTPLRIPSNTFSPVDIGKVKLHVPEDKEFIYADTPVWKDFDIVMPSMDGYWRIGYPNIGDVTATLDNGTLIISGTGNMRDWYESTTPWWNIKDEIKSVVINDGVTKIGSWAFFSCTNLTSVSLPNTMTVLGNHAFDICPIASITIPSSVKTIEDFCFQYCNRLTEIHIEKLIPPTLGFECFWAVNVTSCKLYVPQGTQSAYAAEFGWCFFDIVGCDDDCYNIFVQESKYMRVELHPAVLSITPEKLAVWLSNLDRMYEQYVDLMSGHTPFEGRKMVIRSFAGIAAWAYAGYPIQWNAAYVPGQLLDFANDGDWSFGILHEMGHNFGGHIGGFGMGNTSYNWNEELFANFRMYLALTKVSDGTVIMGEVRRGAEIADYYKNDYDYKVGENLPLDGDGLMWALIRLGNLYQKNGDYGYWLYKQAFAIINNSPHNPDEYSWTGWRKFNHFLDIISIIVDSDVRETFSAKELYLVGLALGNDNPGINPPTVITHSASNITQATATLNKTVTAGTETITEQGFEFKESNASSWQKTNSGNLTGLKENTEYQFRAYATTASGTTYGNILTFSTLAQTLTITSPAYGATYQCGDDVNISVSGYTGDDWQEFLELEYTCLVGEPQPTNNNEPGICKFVAYQRKEAAYSFTFSPETPSIWEGRWVKLVAQNKKNGVRSEPQYIRVGAISYDKTVNVATPGTLCTSIGAQKNTITSLKVTGNLNGADILCLREMAGSDINGGSTSGNLAILDLKDAYIIASLGASNYYYNYNTTTDNTIGAYMFYNCSKLSSIILPNSVTLIDNNSFQFSGLTGISIPPNVTTIDSYAFSGCSKLKTVSIEDGTVELLFARYYTSVNHFINSPIETLYLGRNVYNTYGARDIFHISTLKFVTFGNEVTTIRDDSFYNCTGLQSLIFGNALTSIGNNAFFGCSNLTGTLIIPNKVTTIGSSAFQNCSSLASVTIPNAVTTIGGSAFSGCRNLKEVTIENGTVELTFTYQINTAEHFKNCPIETLNLGRNINNYFAGDPFRDNSALKTVTIGNDVTAINNNSFYNCTGLHSLTLGNSIITIGDNAFRGCSSLEVILKDELIPKKVTTVGAGAFQDCRTLTSVRIPNSVTSIGNDAFSGCLNLRTVKIEDGTVALTFNNDNVFANAPIETLDLGRNINTTSSAPFRDKTSIKTVTIGNDVTAINANSFNNCTGLTKATIGSRVTSLGTDAFYGCNGVTELHSLNPTPPTAPDNCFFNMYATCKLIVPEGSKDKYCVAPEWRKFCEQILTVSPESHNFLANGGSKTITVTSNVEWTVIVPADAASWLTASPTRGSNNGTFTLTATANTSGFSRSVTVKADAIQRKISIEGTTGYETPDAPLAKIYPNPTDGVIHLEFESPGTHNVTIATTSGTMLMRHVITDEIYKIDIGSYPAGVYLLIIDDGRQQSVTKVIKN